MIYIGNFPESYAVRCASHSMTYTHSEQHHGKEVRYYDCWQNEPTEGVNRLSNADGEPNISEIRKFMRYFGDSSEVR